MLDNQYYILKPAVGTKETGMAFPAVESFNDYDFNGPNSVYKLDSDSFPDFTPDIRFKLVKGAKLCDVMGQGTISVCGLLISQNTKDVFDQFNLIPHKYYSATIEFKGTAHQYYWVHFVWDDAINHFDFTKSKFSINEFGENLGDISLNSYEQLRKKQSELGFMKMIYNYKTTMFGINFDLFIHPFNKTIYVSEDLYQSLTHKLLTGTHLSLAENFSLR